MNICATIQARMGSTRLPGKVLKKILGKPMLEYQVERIKQSMLIDNIVVATTTSSQDDLIEKLAKEIGVYCYRGSENDVLSRIVGALNSFKADINVEFMADNPLPDPLLVDAIIGFYLKNKDLYDYVTNALKTTYPPGAEVYVYPTEVLLDAEKKVKETSLREHVGIHIYQNPKYRIHNIEAPFWHCAPKIHLEVDTQEDFEVVSTIIEHFYPHNPGFSLSQIIEYMNDNSELADKNRYVERRWRQYRED